MNALHIPISSGYSMRKTNDKALIRPLASDAVDTCAGGVGIPVGGELAVVVFVSPLSITYNLSTTKIQQTRGCSRLGDDHDVHRC